MKRGKVTIVLDAQAGSCGKGKVVGYLALKDKPAVAINNFMSNAGHTFVSDNGQAIMTQHLPTSLVNPHTILCIGPGAAITPDILFREIERYKDFIGDRKVYIHPRAMVIQEKHREHERKVIRSGSTFKGCGASQAEKIMRVPGVQLFGDYFNKLMKTTMISDTDRDGYNIFEVMGYIEIQDTAGIVNSAIDNGLNVLIEGSQGSDLDINYGLNYPHTTSRQCIAGQLVADCGIAPHFVTDVYMVMRPYPIRISNETNIGKMIYSGDYAGSKEISWDIVKERCGAPDDYDLTEMTSVTKKIRRVFEMNWDRLEYVSMINRPTHIVLNFAQYLDWDLYNNNSYDAAIYSEKLMKFIRKVEKVTGVPVSMIGTGANNSNMIDFRECDVRL